jgi:hypothetical protein
MPKKSIVVLIYHRHKLVNLIYIQEVLGSDLDRDTCYPDWDLLWFSSSLQETPGYHLH